MYGETERKRERKEKKTRRGRENRGGRDGSKVEVKKRSERKGVVGKIHLFEKRYRVTSDARPSLTSLPFLPPSLSPPFHTLLSFFFSFSPPISSFRYACVSPFSIYFFSFSFSILLRSVRRPLPPSSVASRWTRAADFTGCRAEFGRRIFSLEMVNWACAGANERLPGAISSFLRAARPPSRFANAPRRTSLSYRLLRVRLCIRN